MPTFDRRKLIVAGGLQLASFLPKVANSQETVVDPPGVDLIDDTSRTDLFDSEVVVSGLADESNTSVTIKPLALPPVFYFPDDVIFDRIENHPRSNSIFGVDISHYTRMSPGVLSQLKFQRVRFIYTKASQGVGGRDSKFDTYWRALGEMAPQSKISRGAYHFLSSSMPGKQQADYFWARIKASGGLKKDDMPPVLDLEWDRVPGNKDQWRGRGEDYIVENVNECVKRLRELSDREPICYSAKSWFSSQTILLRNVSKLEEIKAWWWADYNNQRKFNETPAVAPGTKTVLWQFTDKARLTAGYDGGLDTSVFYGSEQDFRSTFGVLA